MTDEPVYRVVASSWRKKAHRGGPVCGGPLNINAVMRSPQPQLVAGNDRADLDGPCIGLLVDQLRPFEPAKPHRTLGADD